MTTVREVMSTDPITVEPTTTMVSAAHAMAAVHVGSALVLEAGTLVGILTERDIMRSIASSSSADAARVSPVSAWMTPEPETIHPDAPAGDALDLMLSRGFRHLPVVNGDTIVGVVSMRDLARALSKG
jgi:CBS domain-containing protein